jgi:hypothetical protein
MQEIRKSTLDSFQNKSGKKSQNEINSQVFHENTDKYDDQVFSRHTSIRLFFHTDRPQIAANIFKCFS